MLRLYAAGMAQQQVARRLGRSENAIKECLDRIRLTYERLGRPIGDKATARAAAYLEE